MASFDITSLSVARWDGIIRQRFCHHHLLLEQVVIVESSNHFFFFFFSSSQSSMIVSLRMSGFLLLLENDYLGGGQGQVAKSCHFFDSNEVKCIHHPISQKSGDFVIFLLQTIYYIVQKSGLLGRIVKKKDFNSWFHIRQALLERVLKINLYLQVFFS